MPADVEAVVLELRGSRTHCSKWSARSQVCALRLDVHAAPPLHVLQQLPRELLLAEEPCGLKRGRRACQRIGIRSQEPFGGRGVVVEDGGCERGLAAVGFA